MLPIGDKLKEKHYAVLVLRLLLDQEGRLVYGELVDVASGVHSRTFARRQLLRMVKAWLRVRCK